MKKIFIFPLIVIIVTTLCSCSKTTSSNITVKGQCDEIIRCFNEKDSDGLKNMFCETVKKSKNLDKQIADAFDIIDGKIVSYDYLIGSESKSVDKGKITKLEVYPIIRPLVLSNGKEYELYFYSFLIHEKENNVGISEIVICDSDGNEYVIGDVSLIHPNL